MKGQSNCNFTPLYLFTLTLLFFLLVLCQICHICQAGHTGHSPGNNGQGDEGIYFTSLQPFAREGQKSNRHHQHHHRHHQHHHQHQLSDESGGSLLSNRWRVQLDPLPKDEKRGDNSPEEAKKESKDDERDEEDGQMKYFYPSVPRSELPNFRPGESIDERDDFEESKSSVIRASDDEKDETGNTNSNLKSLFLLKEKSDEKEKGPGEEGSPSKRVEFQGGTSETLWTLSNSKSDWSGEKKSSTPSPPGPSSKFKILGDWLNNRQGEDEEEQRVSTSIRITSKKGSTTSSSPSPFSSSSPSSSFFGENRESTFNEKLKKESQVYFDDWMNFPVDHNSNSGQSVQRNTLVPKFNWTDDSIAFAQVVSNNKNEDGTNQKLSIVKLSDELSLARNNNNNNNNNNRASEVVKTSFNNWKPVKGDNNSKLHPLDEEGSANYYVAAAAPNLFDPYLTARHHPHHQLSPASPGAATVQSPQFAYGQQVIQLQSPPTAANSLGGPGYAAEPLPVQSPPQVHTAPLPVAISVTGQQSVLNDPLRQQIQVQSPANVLDIRTPPPQLATPPVQVNVIRQHSPPAPTQTVVVNEPRIDLVKVHAPPTFIQSPPIVQAVPQHVHHVHHQVHHAPPLPPPPPPPTTTVVHHPPAVVHSPPAVIHHPPAVVHRPPTIVHSPPAVVSRPPTVIHSAPVVPVTRAVPVAPIAIRAYGPPLLHAAPVVQAAPVVHAAPVLHAASPTLVHTPVHQIVAHAPPPPPCHPPALPVLAAPPVHLHAPIVHHPVVPVARAASLLVPAAPARTRTVYTQVQYLPEQTHVVTTTQFAPATKTTIYETDHLAAYSSHKPVVVLPPHSPGKLVPLSPRFRGPPREHATIYTFPSLVKNRIIGAPLRLTDRIRSRRKDRQKERIRQFEERQKHKKDKKIIFIDRMDHQKTFNATARVEEES